jgi:branched-chain amino acid aminotransferase
MAKTGKYLDKAYLRGEIMDYKDATLPLSTSALQYGIGCFAGIRGYKQANGSIGIFRLQDHAKRLAKSAQMLKFTVGLTPEDIADKIRQLMVANAPEGNADIYIRPFIYKSDTILGPSLSGEFDLGIYMLEIDEYLDTNKGLSVGVSSWMRVPDNSIPSRSKATGVYINAALAIDETTGNGYDSAIMLDGQGNVPEGSVMNIFIVKNNQLITPGLGGNLLEGITRRSVVELAEQSVIDIVERDVKRSELYNADEVFFSGTATEIAWVSAVDRREISSEIGPIAKKLQTEFKSVVRGQHNLSADWLDIIKL